MMSIRWLRKWLLAAGAAALTLAGAAHGAGTSIPSLDLGALRADWSHSAVWYGDWQEVSGGWNGDGVGLVRRFGLAAYWGSQPASLPIDIGNGLKLTVYGTFYLYGDGKIYSQISLPGPEAGVTHAEGGLPVLASASRPSGSGSASIGWGAKLRPVLFCASSPCTIKSGPMTIQTLRLGVRDLSGSGAQGAQESDRIIVYGGSPSVKSTCDFSVSPTRIDFGTVKPGFEGDLLARKVTTVTASCSRAEPGSVYIRLDPAHGIDAGDTSLTFFSDPSLGLRYNINADVSCSRSGSLPWGTSQPQKVADMEKPWWSFDSFGLTAFTMTGKGTISWGVCQLQPSVPAGTYRTSVNYTLWVD